MAITWLGDNPLGLDEPKELMNSTRESVLDDGSMSATVELIIDWSLRFEYWQQIVRKRTIWPYHDVAGNHDEHHLYAISAETIPFADHGVSDGVGYGYPTAKMTVQFRQLYLIPSEPTYSVREHFDASAEMISVKTDDLHWGSPTGPSLTDVDNPTQLVIGGEWIRELMGYWPFPPYAVNYVGYVNQAKVYSPYLDMVFNEDTLLLTTPNIRFGYIDDTDGTLWWNITQRFQFRKDGWQKYFRQDTGQYDSMFFTGGSQFFPYPSIPFVGSPAYILPVEYTYTPPP